MTRLTPTVALSLLAWLAFPADAAGHDPDAAPPADAPPLSSVQRLHLPEITQTALPNGLTVVLEENHRAPFVTLLLRYAAGSGDDPPGKEGLAALTQRMTMMTTKHVPAGTYQTWLDRLGVVDSGWGTSPDAMSEWATVPSSALPALLWLWSDQMGFFAPDDPKVLASARETAGNERREKIDNTAYGAVRELTLQALYPPGHPYHAAPVSASIEGLTLQDVREFHDKTFAPNAAVLVLSGDFRSAEVTEQIRRYFGAIPAAAKEPRRLLPARREGEARVDVAASVSAPVVLVNWRTPPYFDAGDAELDVAARVLAGARVSALYWALIQRDKVATAVSARQLSRALGSDFQIRVAVAPGHTPEEALASIDAVLTVARDRGLDDEAYRGARDNVTIPRIYELDHPLQRAQHYADYTLLRHDPRWLANDIGRYETLTAGDVRAAMATWLTRDHRVVTVVTPDPGAPPCGVLRASRGAE